MAPLARFRLSPRVLTLLLGLERAVGRLEGMELPSPSPYLRKRNRIRTVQGSVAIEGNAFTLDQVTDILEGRRVAGPAREIREVQNALSAYERARGLSPWSVQTVRRLHLLLMRGLVADAGKWRRGNVGIFRGQKLRHLPPPASRVPGLMTALVRALQKDVSTPVLVRACLAHYELQFIHPFSDGNGRVGRLWQHVILLRASPVFELVPAESLVRERQTQYCRSLARADASGDATPFVEFILDCLLDALEDLASEFRGVRARPEDRLERAGAELPGWFTRKDYLELFKELSTATASRDLHRGVEEGRLVRRGTLALTEYRFTR
jgi:Fic family protein